MRVIVTGGGTGGHIYPALSIAQGIKEKYPNTFFLYIGTEKGLEKELVPKAGIPFKTISVSGLKRKISLKNLLVLWQAGSGFWQVNKIIKEFKPDLVIGTGGYVTGPVLMSAVLQRIPTLIHEQNALPGITNRLLAPWVTMVAVTFSDSIKRFSPKTRIKLTGLPVRSEIFKVNKEQAYARLGLNPDLPVVLVFGGSRGARSLNLAMAEVVAQIKKEDQVQILHATGQVGYEDYLKTLKNAGISLVNNGNITTVPYIYNMQDALAVSQLVICRSGAATLAELTALGLPSILIPYPYAAENHQEYNALALVNQGAAAMIRDGELTGEKLYKEMMQLITNPQRLQQMAKNSLTLAKRQSLSDIMDIVDGILTHS